MPLMMSDRNLSLLVIKLLLIYIIISNSYKILASNILKYNNRTFKYGAKIYKISRTAKQFGRFFAITLEFYCHPCLFSPSCQASLYCQDMPVQLAREFSPDIYDIREIVMIKKTPSVTCHMEIFDFFLPHTSPLLL